MAALLPSRTVSVSIARPADVVYAYVSDPVNMAQWAPGFARAVRREGNGWVAETADGPMGLEYAPTNAYRVADHRVTVRPGLEVLNPMRVLVNGDGAEVLFTLFQAADMTDEQFETDTGLVTGDLQLLKRLLESDAPPA